MPRVPIAELPEVIDRRWGMHRAVLALVGAVVLVAACSASPAGPGGPGSSSPQPSVAGASPGATGEIGAGLLVEISEVGGLVSPIDLATRVPGLAIYADGRVIRPVYLPTVFPGPLLPSVHETRVTPAGLQQVLELAGRDGLTAHDQRYPARGVADVPDTVITVVVNGTAVTSRFGALASGETVSDPTEAAARTGAEDFRAQLTGSSVLLAPYQVGQEAQYVPEAVQIVAVPGDPSSGVQPPELARLPLAWPLSVPLSAFGSSLPAGSGAPAARCGVVSGADLRLLWPVLQDATQISGFTSAGGTWTLTPRALLPGEPGSCGGA